MNKNYPDFREHLQLAMKGYATQADFAKEAGIAPETLNRMINQGEINRPSKTTLRKIANVARNGVTYNMLLQACGYAEDVVKKPNAPSDVNTQFIDFCEFLQSHKMITYPSIQEFIDSAIMLGSACDISYTICDTTDTADADAKKGDYATIINLSCNINSAMSAATDFVVFSYHTDKDACIIASVTNEADVVVRYGSSLAKTVLDLRQKANNSQSSKPSNILYCKKEIKRKFEQATMEERLLHAIFGDDQTVITEETVHISGIGFYLPHQMPKFVMQDFLKAHKDTFCRSTKEERIYTAIVENGDSRTSVAGNYNVETNTGAGSNCWLGIIVNIIFRETGINTQGWLNALHDGSKPIADAIVFANSMPWEYTEEEKCLTRRNLINTLDKYARELRTVINDCSFDATYTKAESHK